MRGVIFDLDQTLYRLGAVKLRMTLRLLGSLGVLRQLSFARGQVRHRTYAGREALMGELYRILGERSGLSASRAGEWFQERFMGQFVEMLAASGRPRPGAKELLESLATSGVKTAVLSDFGHIVERLEALGMDPGLFDALVASEEHGVLKPSPKPVLAIAREWGVPPEDILIVGDRADLDEECARSAGAKFIGVSDRAGDSRVGYLDWKTASNEIGAMCGVGVSK